MYNPILCSLKLAYDDIVCNSKPVYNDKFFGLGRFPMRSEVQHTSYNEKFACVELAMKLYLSVLEDIKFKIFCFCWTGYKVSGGFESYRTQIILLVLTGHNVVSTSFESSRIKIILFCSTGHNAVSPSIESYRIQLFLLLLKGPWSYICQFGKILNSKYFAFVEEVIKFLEDLKATELIC